MSEQLCCCEQLVSNVNKDRSKISPIQLILIKTLKLKMLKKHKIIFIVFIVFSFLLVTGVIFSERLEIHRKAVLRQELKQSPLGTIEPQNPFFSQPLEQKEIPQGAIRIKASSEKFQPAKFRVKSGELVVLVLTSIDNNQHSLFFEDEVLARVNIISEGKITRGIVFFAPERPGEYRFFDSQALPETKKQGVMIVR
jgi:plastocyanin